MSRAEKEKVGCANCGMEIRPDTQFCYYCGRSLTATVGGSNARSNDTPIKSETPATSNQSLKDLETALAAEFPPKGGRSKLDAAAAERRKARKAVRSSTEVIWEDGSYRTDLLYYLVVVLVMILAWAIVYLVVISR